MSTRRPNRRRPSGSKMAAIRPRTHGVVGGRYAPLELAALKKIDHAARQILSTIGLGEAPPEVVDAVMTQGGEVAKNGRLLFSLPLIERALASFNRDFTLFGRAPGQDMWFHGQQVYVGTGGAAPTMMDHRSQTYRPSTLLDLHDAARLVNCLENIHFLSRPVVARDIEGPLALDINTAFACLSGTTKPIFTSASSVDSVQAIAEMCWQVAGSQTAFVERPFLALNINHVVPPLRFDADACRVMQKAVQLGIPCHANTFGQVGASEPVTLAGSLAQTTAETLAGMIFAWCVNPEAKITFGARPMITDLRTGGMAGGAGEQAAVMACATQMAKYYDLPDTCIAGATDSKISDAQSGFEKSLSVTLAAQAGSNAITQAAGTQASLMVTSLESLVIDNDMLGAILRSIAPLEVNDETLNLSAIEAVVLGDGHYFGQSDTLKKMQSDFLYPDLSDRKSVEQWEEEGALDIKAKARTRVDQLLSKAPYSVLTSDVDKVLRSDFNIVLSER